MSPKVGIVLVSYNASTAVRVTLASLRAARNDVPYELVLVDNASREEERVAIRRAVERHVDEAGVPWTFVQQPENLGFSGGNNVGVRRLLADESITHVCLLNSDVVVVDGWLDQLLACDRSIVSPVTNKAEGEQWVPADYQLALDDALDEGTEQLRGGVAEAVGAFAAARRQAFGGHVVDCDATFFCVVLRRDVLEQVGLLDETFFPGGFEDDDYCLRARAAGHPVHLARGVYLHHWGSASFGKLDFEYFSSNAERNRGHLEAKHGITWQRRQARMFLSFAHDVEASASCAASAAGGRRRLLALHADALGDSLQHFLAEFRNLYAGLQTADALRDERTAERASLARDAESLSAEWRRLGRLGVDGRTDAAWVSDLHAFVELVRRMVDESFAIHALIASAREVGGAADRPGLLRRLWSIVRHGVPFVWRLRGVVFIGGYPYRARDKDGYFQRIRAIDGMFDDRWRIYFDPTPLPGQDAWYDMPAPQTLVLRGGGSSRLRRLFVVALVWSLALRCRLVYFHSVLRMEDQRLGRMLRLPFVRRVLDVHGVVPEEFRMHDDFFSARIYERHEEAAARRAHCLIVVTESMRQYLLQKYGNELRAHLIVLPIFPGIEPVAGARPYHHGRPVTVYAGGLHRWQQVPKMVDAIERTIDWCDHRFYCTEPAVVEKMLSDAARASGHVVVDSKSHEQLLGCYREAHFGFLLRQDSVVNHVACPTKVVEYLAAGVVPIVDSEHVGDFASLGMQSVPLADFLAGRVPDEATRDRMAVANLEVYGRLRAQREAGFGALRDWVGGRVRRDGLIARAMWQAAKLLPPDTRRGRFARSVYRKLRGAPAAQVEAAPVRPIDAEPCDVLVQVDNFNAGGLENVVLDLNVAFRDAGLRVGMLVLGERGDAVARAREQGVAVVAAPYDEQAYRHWLATARPKVVMSHYSPRGAALCAAAGVPVLQIVHNTYMWLDDAQRSELLESAKHTTLFAAVSEYARDYSLRRLGLPAERCRVVANGIEVERYRGADRRGDREQLRRRLGVSDDAFVFLSVGSINHQKNHLSLVRAFVAIAERCPNAHLVVIGPPHEPELVHRCRALVQRHGLERRVVFAGGVPDAHRYYAMADCYAHAAFFEGGQLSMLEALVADLPIVTTEIGFAMHFRGRPGVRVVDAHFDIVDYDGHITQMPASPETERQLAEAMAATYADPVRPGLPPAIIESFDRSNAYQTYVELVRELIAGKTPTIKAIEKRSWAKRMGNVG